MARPTKQGVDYFPLDVGFLQDFKIKRILNSYGCASISILVSLLCNIYKDKGYYIEFTDDTVTFIAVEVGVKEHAVQDVVAKAVQVGFFDEHIYKTHKILTSKGIQERYFMVSSRRKERFCRSDIMLININVCNNPVNVCNNPVNVCNNPVNVCNKPLYKENKIKEKEKRKNSFARTEHIIDFNFKEKQEKTFNRKRQELAKLAREIGISKEM